MNYLDIKDPAELRAAVEANSRWSPAIDALEAAARDARRLAPHNRYMRKHTTLGAFINTTLTRLRETSDTIVPIVRVVHGESSAMEVERHGDQPLSESRVVAYCNVCSEATRGDSLVPFWVATQSNIMQINMCPACADVHILEYGAVPQWG